MRWFATLAALCLGLSAFASPAHSPNSEKEIYGYSTSLGEDVSCYQDSYQKRQWAYCITRTEHSTNPDVMFEFHGLGESENGWINKQRNYRIRYTWHAEHLQAPTVVSVSFGSIWLLAEKNAAAQSGLFELFRDVVYPRILQKLGPIHGQKLLLGASMGGFNASQIYLKTPQMFDRYIMICPIIADVSPFASSAAIQKYIEDNNASPFRVYAMIDVAKSFFADQKSFDKAYALKLGSHVLGRRSPPVYLSCSHEDPYGIFNSVQKFKDLALSRGVDVQWRDTHGPHCTIDSAEVARYIVTK